jgi:hypothetical protein
MRFGQLKRREFVAPAGGVATMQLLAVRAQQTTRGAYNRRWAATAAAITFGLLVLLGGAQGAAEDNSIRNHETEAMPLDAFGYLGGLFEARFYEPHSTTGDPSEEIRQAASLLRPGLGDDEWPASNAR